MRISVLNGSIHLEPESNADINYIYTNNAYKASKNSTYAKVPLTLISLEKIKQDFNLQSPEYDKIVFETAIDLEINRQVLNYQQTNLFRPYQIQGINWVKTRLQQVEGVGLLWDPRTGKTRTTCEATKDYQKIIVLSLAGQEDNWTSTYNQISGRECFNLHRKNPTKRKAIYEQFIFSSDGILVGSVNTVSSDALQFPELFSLMQINILIIDEIHKIKNNKTLLHKGAKILRKHSDKVIGLTGTPVSKNVGELVPIITFLIPTFSKTYLHHYFFNIQISRFDKYGSPTSIKKEKEAEWLEFLGLYFSQVKQEQALPWATEPEQITILLEMEEIQKQAYRNMLFSMEADLYKDKKHYDTLQIQEVIAQITRLRQISLAPWLINYDGAKVHGGSVKEEWLLDFIKTQTYDGLIVFSTFSSYLEELKIKLEKLNYKVGIITGKTSNKIVIQDAFQNKEYDILLCNILSGSKGLTLDRADTMIFLDEDWRPDELEQARRRFDPTSPDRVKDKLIQIYTLQIKDTFVIGEETINSIDKYINDAVQNKITNTEIINKFKVLWNEMKENKNE